MQTMFVHHHMGVGDHICMYGLLQTLIDQYALDRLYVFVKHKNMNLLKDLYTGTKVEMIPIPQDLCVDTVAYVDEFCKKNGVTCFRIGYNMYTDHPHKTCDQVFYELANVPYENRFTHFTRKRNVAEEDRIYTKLNPTDEPYIFVHDDPSRGFSIDVKSPLKIIRNDMSESLFNYGKVLEKAKEFHCMESSFKCLAEHLDMNPTRMVYYRTMRSPPWTVNPSRYTWEVI